MVWAQPARRRVAGGTAWAVAFAAVGLAVLGVAGSFVGETRFDPTDLGVPPGAMILLAVTSASFATMGALLASRVRRSPLGWLLLGIGASVAVTLAGMAYVAVGWAGDRWGLWAQECVSVCSFFLIVYVMLFFPDGRLTSPRWRPALWLAHLTAAAVLTQTVTPYTSGSGDFTNPIGVAALRDTVFTDNKLGFALIPLATIAAVVSLVVRFRRSAGLERQQLKWIAYAGTIVASAYLVQNATWFTEKFTSKTVAGLGLLLLIAAFATVPVACAAAVLRYRLFDIDRLISRSVAYLAVTGIVTAGYVGVISAGAAVSPGESQIAVAAATLLAAAAFNPLRHRVQAVVDRRFNRPHFDAVQLVESFAAELRTTVSTEAVVDELGRAVAGTVQPAHVSLWRADVG